MIIDSSQYREEKRKMVGVQRRGERERTWQFCGWEVPGNVYPGGCGVVTHMDLKDNWRADQGFKLRKIHSLCV